MWGFCVNELSSHFEYRKASPALVCRHVCWLLSAQWMQQVLSWTGFVLTVLTQNSSFHGATVSSSSPFFFESLCGRRPTVSIANEIIQVTQTSFGVFGLLFGNHGFYGACALWLVYGLAFMGVAGLLILLRRLLLSLTPLHRLRMLHAPNSVVFNLPVR